MSVFKPCKGTRSNLDSLPIKEGQFITCTDTGDMFLDISDTKRISVGVNIPVNPQDTTNLNIWIEDK